MIFTIHKSLITQETVFVEFQQHDANTLADIMEDCGFTNFYVTCMGQYENAIVFISTTAS